MCQISVPESRAVAAQGCRSANRCFLRECITGILGKVSVCNAHRTIIEYRTPAKQPDSVDDPGHDNDGHAQNTHAQPKRRLTQS